MPYLRPTLTALRTQASMDITSSPLPGADGLLTKSVLRVMAWVQAGFAFLHYDYLDWISEQSTPWNATAERAAGWGALVGISQEDATIAGVAPALPGAATFTAVAGTLVPNGSAITRQDGTAFASTADAIASGTTVVVSVAATVAGSAGNTPVGSVLTLTTPIAGVNSAGSCTTPIVGGTDQEQFGAFRARYLAQYAAPPQGGDKSDYIEWMLAVPGVTRAWVIPYGAGPGTVVVYPMLDVAEAGNGGFPLGTGGVATAETRAAPATGDLLTVANALLPLQPVTALVYAAAPQAAPVAFTVANLSPNTTVIQAGVQAALTDMFLQLDQVGGSVNPVTGAAWGTIYPSDWTSAIAAVSGIAHFTVTSPSAPITPGTGQLLTLGATTFSS